ncbi:LIM and calponin homology domains-containing protein 1-like isoform X2 [Scomber scombrus]|uniref:LIM and calponin homology domains-containing protein 1-like isoform X2 n=1 Tax=Scomber scombrus TaxID=13677 RepID=UPI002DD881D3|nr:LIM and calponin homology domains-containing protein 1-like isoform X2 [Scomber scombrus]
MASQAAGRDAPNASRDEPESSEPQPSHPEPACQEAQKWIEAVTGKSFGDKDFRSALENGILLCELLSAIKPGLVKKINRLPTPIAGLDNLSVFLRGCEELGLRGSQLFDPGDLQDTSIRANLKDSDCNRKLKNVLNTVFWLGKAASGCASYSGPTLNLKEFEGLLAQMKVESERGGEISQNRSVRDSGYDCWDSERSESLSPPRHTRDNSLDSLDSFGSRSQHSPSPDVVNRGNNDGRGSDSEADAPSRKPDVRKDDMLARRTSSSEARSSIPFNQFLPNRTNASSYVPNPRRKSHMEEGEQRRSVSMSDMLNEDEVGHLPTLSQSRYERMQEQYNNFEDDEDQWQNELTRWKNRRRSASQELIKKEEERKRIEKRMKEERSDCNKRKSIKTYKEIVEEKERREVELREAYKNAATPEEAAMILQRYALRFTISDATLDSLKLPRSTSKPKPDPDQVDKEHKPVHDSETLDPLHEPESTVTTDQKHTKPEDMQIDKTAQQETLDAVSSSPSAPKSPLPSVTHLENTPPHSQDVHEPETQPTESPSTHKQPIKEDAQPETKQTPPQTAEVQPHTPTPVHPLPSLPSVSARPVPLLAAKPYCQPRNLQSGHKPVKMDGLVRVNGEATEDSSVTIPPASPLHSPEENKDVPSKLKETEVPSKQTETDVPSKQTETEVSSKQTETEVPFKQTETEVPSKQTETEVPSKQTETEVPSKQTETEVPSKQKETEVPSKQTETEVSSKQIETEVPFKQTETEVPSKQTETEVHSKQTETEVPSKQKETEVPSKQTETEVPSKQTETEVPSKQTASTQETAAQLPPRQTEKPPSSSGSSISSLLGGRNCVIKTTIVTELTQTHVESLPLEVQSNGQVNGTMRSVGKPAEEEKAQPVVSPCSMQEYSPTVTEGLEESNVNEQYQKEQEKLKKEWEKAQLEVEEEERKHNEEERKILEETVTPLNPSSLFNQQSCQTGKTSSAPENNETQSSLVPLQQNGQKISTGNEDQHASKLHFFQDSACDGEPSKKQELWKTSSLDRNPQLNQANIVKRSGSHDIVSDKKQPSSSSPQPPSPSRCVSGKRLCTGCSQPLGKGAAMIIDTLGLFFHMQCFKCGVCEGQLGDTTAGTDVRIRNGLLSCHDCYIASRGKGQPTTL